jgi:CheY-like chemotaxis protein
MPASLNILLVEDNEGDVGLTRRALNEARPPCTVAVAHDGLEALDVLLKRGGFADAATPQLILLDLNMPRMDGKQFLEAVKADDRLKAIPVVMFTSSQSAADIRECYKRHASCYVVKPFGGRELAAALQQVAAFWGALVQLPT